MRLAENVRLALRRLRVRPVRSFLLLQGTIWGVAVAIFPSATIEGTRSAVAERGSEFGADRVAITNDPTGVDPKPLDASDVAAVAQALARDGVPVIALAGVAVTTFDPRMKLPAGPAAYLAGPPDAFEARGLSLASGRAVNPDAAVPEAVVEGLLAEALARAKGSSALGLTLSLPGGRSAVVVGTLAPRTPLQRRLNDLGFDTEHPVFRGATRMLLLNLGVPLEDDGWKRTDRCVYVAAPKMISGTAVDWVFLRVPPERLREGSRVARHALGARGKTVLAFYPPVYPLFLHRDVDRFKTVSLALFVACLAMSAVVMAGVGLLAALRRAPEIAIHRVEGATEVDVVVQFLVEALVLSVGGSLLGWGLGCGLATLRIALEPMAGMAWRFPWPHAFVTLAVAVLVGCLATLLPALSAARRDPVESLVDE